MRALRDCKQRSLTVSKKAPTVSKKSFPLENSHLTKGAFLHLSPFVQRPKPFRRNLWWYLFSLLQTMAAMYTSRSKKCVESSLWQQHPLVRLDESFALAEGHIQMSNKQ